MKSYNEIAKEVLRRRDERIALAAKRRAAAVKTGSVIACFCVVAISGFFAVNNDYITKSVVETTFNTVEPQSGDDPISAYVTDESDTTDVDTTDPVSSDSQSESEDTTTDPITVIPPETEPEPPETDTPGTSEPPSTRPEPPETTDPPGTSEPPSTKPEPPVTTDLVPTDTEPSETDDTDTSAPPETDPTPGDTAPGTSVPKPPSYYDPYPPYGDPVNPGLDWAGDFGFSDVGSAGVSSSDSAVTKADFFYLLYYRYSETRVKAEQIFVDCSKSSWCFEPAYWASQSGILTAVPSDSDEYFNPFRKILLQDIACYLYAFAGSPEAAGSLESYEDYFRISPYAVPAMTWCVEQGIITDVHNYLSPLSSLTLSELEDVFTAFESVIN